MSRHVLEAVVKAWVGLGLGLGWRLLNQGMSV